MEKEQKEKWAEWFKLIQEFNKRMDEIFPRDEKGNLQDSSKIVSEAEVQEVLKLARQIERIGKELYVV